MYRLVFVLLIPFYLTSQVKAFPTAFGAAASTTGGRGEQVYIVSTLADSGISSFRDAVSASNRIITFEVSGTINLTSNLTITASNLTIAGQSSPEGGIAITGSKVFFDSANNIIVRYIRFRPTYDDNGSVDAVNVNACDNIIFDHCSISWSADEAISFVGDSDNITIQNSIIAESATGMLAGDSNNFISSNISIHNNLWYNTSHRFPNVNANRVDAINNIVHNWNTRIMVVSSHDNVQLNEINNYYQRGARPTNVLDAAQHAGNWLDIGTGSDRPNIRIYTNGNVVNDALTETGDSWELYRHRFAVTSGAYAGISQWDAANRDFENTAPFSLLGTSFPFTSAIEAKAIVETNSGAYETLDGSGNVIQDWDVLDDRYLGHVINNTFDAYVYQAPPASPTIDIASKSWYTSYISSISSTPINFRGMSYDTDRDGMPDAWETATFGDLSRDGRGDLNGDGYTDVEEYLNLVDFDGGPSNSPIIERRRF